MVKSKALPAHSMWVLTQLVLSPMLSQTRMNAWRMWASVIMDSTSMYLVGTTVNVIYASTLPRTSEIAGVSLSLAQSNPMDVYSGLVSRAYNQTW